MASITVTARPNPPKRVLNPPSVEHRIAFLAVGAAIRICLFALAPGLSDLLGDRVEVATPINSFRRIQEGLFLFGQPSGKSGLYDGGLYHQSPFFMSIFSLLPSVEVTAVPVNTLFIMLDLVCANTLVSLAVESNRSLNIGLKTPRLALSWTPLAVGAAYLLNPLTIVSCLARSTSVFTHLPILFAMLSAMKGQAFSMCYFIAVATYLSMYPVLLVPVLFYACYHRRQQLGSTGSFAVAQTLQLAIFAIFLGTLLSLSYVVTHSWDFIPATYGFLATVEDLNPNVGIWWYFLTEIFDPFRSMFIALFWIHVASYVGGFTTRFHQQPIFAAIAMMGVFAAYLPYPSVSDTAMFMGLLGVYSHVFGYMRYPFVAIAALLYSAVLGPTFHHLWIYAGSGNANFFYAITLVWTFAQTILIGDAVYAVVVDEFRIDYPGDEPIELK